LITIYNRRLFDQAGIVAPPKSWDEVIALIPRLRTLTADGSVERAAIAAGGSETSVHSGVDLLFALMMQNGTRMNSEDFTTATFNSSAGADGFNFYLQFARRGSPNYTWDESLPNSIESFALGQVAMIFDYRGAVSHILEKNPYADPSVAPFPQQDPENPIAYPSYLGIGVSNQTELSTWAWDFITFITTSNEAISYYLEHAKRPPALRALIGANIEDPYWSMSARQALVARSWIPGDGTGATAAFNEQIRAILQEKTDIDTALVTLQDKVNEFLAPQNF
jgi:ABC-type glycerol-3-phosphate transport system substrate-binding protein